jgi:hypothetical protein
MARGDCFRFARGQYGSGFYVRLDGVFVDIRGVYNAIKTDAAHKLNAARGGRS